MKGCEPALQNGSCIGYLNCRSHLESELHSHVTHLDLCVSAINGPRVANVGLQADVDLEVGEQWRGRPVLNDAGSSLRSSSNSDSG